ncbi:hypothetical protein L3Q82_007703 [Scortum barcoo]|uniref:Uncharacterized protein n=1 Tax=Scortum barcoo TaxID=214431 RepID=A0ACB8WS10_9TELE|nr:hypothetical protein L3Q82_007703 [Scortum barcoo]
MMLFCWLHQARTFSMYWGGLQPECEAAGMGISTSKSEAMVLDRKRVACPLRVGGEVLPQVEEFNGLMCFEYQRLSDPFAQQELLLCGKFEVSVSLEDLDPPLSHPQVQLCARSFKAPVLQAKWILVSPTLGHAFAMRCCGSSSVCGDLAWEPEGHQFKSPQTSLHGGGLVAGEVPVHLLSTAEVPLSKAPNPKTCSGLAHIRESDESQVRIPIPLSYLQSKSHGSQLAWKTGNNQPGSIQSENRYKLKTMSLICIVQVFIYARLCVCMFVHKPLSEVVREQSKNRCGNSLDHIFNRVSYSSWGFKGYLAPTVTPSHLPLSQLAHFYSIHTATTDGLLTSNCARSTHAVPPSAFPNCRDHGGPGISADLSQAPQPAQAWLRRLIHRSPGSGKNIQSSSLQISRAIGCTLFMVPPSLCVRTAAITTKGKEEGRGGKREGKKDGGRRERKAGGEQSKGVERRDGEEEDRKRRQVERRVGGRDTVRDRGQEPGKRKRNNLAKSVSGRVLGEHSPPLSGPHTPSSASQPEQELLDRIRQQPSRPLIFLCVKKKNKSADN